MKLILIYFTCSFTFYVSAQKPTKKRIDLLISNLETGVNPEGLPDLDLYTEIDSLSQLIDYPKGIIYGKLGKIQEFSSNSPNARFTEIDYLTTLLKSNPDSFSDTNKVYFYILKGRGHSDVGNYLGELEAYFKADQIALTSNNLDLQSFATNALCMYYSRRKEYEKALLSNRKLISFYKNYDHVKDENNKYRYLTLLRNAGIYHYGLSNYDSTIYYVNQAIKNGYDRFGKIINAHILLGNSYLKLGKLNMATRSKDYIENAMDSSYDAFGPEGFRAYLFFGDFYRTQKKFSTASDHYSMALMIADSTGQMEEQSDAHDKIVLSALESYGRTDLIRNFQLSHKISDALFSDNSIRLEKQMRVQYNTAKKEKEIDELKYTNEVERRTKTMIILGSIIALITAILIGMRIHTRRKLLARKLELSAVENEVLNFKLTNTLDQINEKAKLLHNIDKDTKINVQSLSYILDGNYLNESKWNEVIYYFDQLNDNFSTRITKKFPQLTSGDIQLLILIKLNYSNKSIAIIRNVTEAGVKKAKSRLAKKLNFDVFSDLYPAIFKKEVQT